jgi:hypothetical protein
MAGGLNSYYTVHHKKRGYLASGGMINAAKTGKKGRNYATGKAAD